jgi:hypothetical protein
MASNIYVRSGAGGSNNGTDWTNAYVAFASAVTVATAVDTIYVAHDHDEMLTAHTQYDFPTTVGLKVLCVNTSTGVLATTGKISSNGNYNTTLNNYVYCYGLVVIAGSADSTGSNKLVRLNQTRTSEQYWESCTFGSLGQSVYNGLKIGYSGYDNFTTLKNCTFSCGHENENIALAGDCHIDNLTLAGSTPIFLFAGGYGSPNILIENSTLLWGGGQCFHYLHNGGRIVVRNCRVKNLTYLYSSESYENGIICHNISDGAKNYEFYIGNRKGTIRNENTRVRTGGASDGTTSMAWKMITTADSKNYFQYLESPEITKWNETTGSPITVTVEILTDNVTLKDDEIWLEVDYLGSSSYPIGSALNDRVASVLATPANQETSEAAWTTTGLSTPVKQKLSVTITPQMKGVIHAKVKLAKASTTVYVCPKIDIS